MSGRRLLKAAEAIREVVSMAILAELKDPRIRHVTVTHVEVSPDMRHAKVHVSVMGDETQQNLSLRGLQSACGFLQSKIAEQINTRYTPRLMFVLDQGVKKSIEMAQLLKQVLPPSSDEPAATEDTFEIEDDDDRDRTSQAADSPSDEESESAGKGRVRRPR